MRGIWRDMNGASSKGGGGCNQQGNQENSKRARDGTSGDGQGLSDEDESRLNEDVNDGRTELVESHPVQNALQHQPQGPQLPPGPVVRWERFLPQRSLKVLLVENDDSTRHIVNALLRNCSYEVTAVENGLEAWKILEDLTNHIDLVLTEVDMPYLSGIGLLSKIMKHKTCKNTPVIMMSCNDSMGVVFNCLSKGAVDFLVKPIRKNELKNLWQHVWRKCHSSSGSGSESGIRTQKSVKSKSKKGSANEIDSNDEDDNGSVGLSVRDGSDNGSGTQSSWSKRAAEIDSPQVMSPWDQLADPPNRNCARVTHSNPDILHDNEVPATVTRECQKMDIELDLEIGASRNLNLQLQGPSHNVIDTTGIQKENQFDLELKGKAKELENARVDLNDEAPGLQSNDADVECAATGLTPQMELRGNDIPSHPSNVSNVKSMAAYDTKAGPSLELSLKQLRDTSDTGTSVQERNILRHSGLSAFSRYNQSKNANQTPTGNVGSCSPVDNSSEAAKTDSMHNLISSSSGTPNARSNGSSNNNDMGSTTNNIAAKPETCGDRSMPKSTDNIHHGSAYQPVQNSNNSSLQQVSASQLNPKKQQIQVQHHHHHYHHHHHHVHNLKQQQQLNHDGLSPLNKIATSPHFAHSDIFTATIEGNAANYPSASGSNNGSGQNGSSGQHGNSTGVIADGINVTSDNCEAGKCGAAGGISSGSGLDENRMARREAALNKFRQKRKERCFEKKVRYQSRKRLAEQRPRVRGQFVRQAVDENKRKDESDDGDS